MKAGRQRRPHPGTGQLAAQPVHPEKGPRARGLPARTKNKMGHLFILMSIAITTREIARPIAKEVGNQPDHMGVGEDMDKIVRETNITAVL